MPTLPLAAPLAAAPCADGEQVCDLVYDWTDSARFADWADVLIGTPFPQVRTTQMLAVALALPYVALAASSVAAVPKRSTRLRLRPEAAPA